MITEQIVSLTFFRFQHFSQHWWALRQMQWAAKQLEATPGLVFYKMLGSGGGNGFSLFPDLSTYALLLVWNHPDNALHFFAEHPYYQQLVQHAAYQWTLQMKPIGVKGQWDGAVPFQVHPHSKYEQGPIAVLTRATIHTSRLLDFWKHVPSVSKHLASAHKGLLFSKGIGEIPFRQQATFSLWKDREAMVDYAYRGAEHRKIILKTKKQQWYKEELFAEFVPISISGELPEVSVNI